MFHYNMQNNNTLTQSPKQNRTIKTHNKVVKGHACFVQHTRNCKSVLVIRLSGSSINRNTLLCHVRYFFQAYDILYYSSLENYQDLKITYMKR